MEEESDADDITKGSLYQPSETMSTGEIHPISTVDNFIPTASQDLNILMLCETEYGSEYGGVFQSSECSMMLKAHGSKSLNDSSLNIASDEPRDKDTNSMKELRYLSWIVQSNCCYCSELQSDLRNHQLEEHQNENEIMAILAITEETKKRALWTLIRNKGNHMHNLQVMAKGQGTLLVNVSINNGEEQPSPSDHLICCQHCYGYFFESDIANHWCPMTGFMKGSKVDVECYLLTKRGQRYEALAKLLNCQGKAKDKLSRVIQNDPTIVEWGCRLVGKNKLLEHGGMKICTKLKRMGKILLQARKQTKQNQLTLAQALQRQHFSTVISAAKEVTGTVKHSNSQLYCKTLLAFTECALFCKVTCLQKGAKEEASNHDEFIQRCVLESIKCA